MYYQKLHPPEKPKKSFPIWKYALCAFALGAAIGTCSAPSAPPPKPATPIINTAKPDLEESTNLAFQKYERSRREQLFQRVLQTQVSYVDLFNHIFFGLENTPKLQAAENDILNEVKYYHVDLTQYGQRVGWVYRPEKQPKFLPFYESIRDPSKEDLQRTYQALQEVPHLILEGVYYFRLKGQFQEARHLIATKKIPRHPNGEIEQDKKIFPSDAKFTNFLYCRGNKFITHS